MARSDQQKKQAESEANQSSVTVKCGEQSQFELQEDCGGGRQAGEGQSHTMDSAAAGHVTPDTMFPRVKIERKQQMESKSMTLGAKRIPFKTNEGVQRCITFKSANVVKPIISMQKVVQAGNSVVLDEKNPHIRNTGDGTVIKLHENNGVYTMDMWICLDETCPVFSWR